MAEKVKATAHYLRIQAHRKHCRHTGSHWHPVERAIVVASVADTAAVAVALGIVHRQAHRPDDPVSLVVVHAVIPSSFQMEASLRPEKDTLVVGEVSDGLNSQECHSHLGHDTHSSWLKNVRGLCKISPACVVVILRARSSAPAPFSFVLLVAAWEQLSVSTVALSARQSNYTLRNCVWCTQSAVRCFVRLPYLRAGVYVHCRAAFPQRPPLWVGSSCNPAFVSLRVASQWSF